MPLVPRGRSRSPWRYPWSRVTCSRFAGSFSMMRAARATSRTFFGHHSGAEQSLNSYEMTDSDCVIVRIASGPPTASRFIGASSSFWKWFESEGFVVCLLAVIGVTSFVFLYRGVAIWKAVLVLVVFSITCTWFV